MFFNSDRWRRAKGEGTPDRPYRDFTNESGGLWGRLSNAEQAVWDAQAAHEPFCHERARKRGLTKEEAGREDCQKCLERCRRFQERGDQLAKRAGRLERRAEQGPRPLNPFMEFSARHRRDYLGDPTQRAKALGAAWRELAGAQKRVYETAAYREWRRRVAVERDGA